ncbi:MAG: helix-turn-helix domain-containing protein [Oscillospiraceae bacterium]|nr:helix-turn-helix domain-containing protein [Oscillospiraceae bacterium]MBQ2633445.1 helix-turn-helix domain-containing protein [Oscillospiraceae bacterium]
MDKTFRYPGYTALLPPRVRYDQTLRPTAKLLYAEISAMADVTGFCWASNRYLAALFGVTKNTVTELLGQLSDAGYIEIEVLRDEKNAVQERRLYITDTGLMRLPPITKNRDRGTPKNPDTPPPKNREENNNKILIYPPIVPQRGTQRAKEHKDAPDWLPDDFEKLWQWYPTGEIPRPAPRGNRQRAIRAWDKLHPSPELVDTIAAALARQAATEQWQQGVGIPHLSTYLNGYGWEGWEDGKQ